MREALEAWLPADLAEWMAAADEIRATWKRGRRADARSAGRSCWKPEPVV